MWAIQKKKNWKKQETSNIQTNKQISKNMEEISVELSVNSLQKFVLFDIIAIILVLD